MKCRQLIYAFVFLGLMLSEFTELNAQTAASNEVVNDAKREEIQRYFGYELLLYRYLSLPYDVSVNINQQANFVDIGALYILFLPLLILLLMGDRRWLKALSILYLCFTWVISTSNSFVFSISQDKIPSKISSLDAYLNSVSFSQEPFAYLLAVLYKFSLTVYQPLEGLGQAVSGNSDYISYPIIFSLFILLSLFLTKPLKRLETKHRMVVVFFWAYAFYWFAFSGGIPWYGNILFLLGLFMVPMLNQLLEKDNLYDAKLVGRCFVVLGSVWMVFALANRTSDIQPLMDKKFFAKGLFNPIFYEYATGKVDARESLDLIYPGINKAFDRINSDKDAKVLRIGTSLNYYIENNNTRVLADNQLGLFHELYVKYPDYLSLVDVFKASGIKYIVLDLNTATIDFTPDKSLTAKYSEVLRFVINNPYLKLLATDRVVGNRGQNGQMVYTRNIYGEQIQVFGRYAIFELS